MEHGGKRKGSGIKKGGRKQVKDGSLVFLSPKMYTLSQEFLNSEDKHIRLKAWQELLPYVFKKQPSETHLGGLGSEPIKVTILEIGSNGSSA